MNQTMLHGIQTFYLVVVALSIFGYGMDGRGVMANIVIDGRTAEIWKTMQD